MDKPSTENSVDDRPASVGEARCSRCPVLSEIKDRDRDRDSS